MTTYIDEVIFLISFERILRQNKIRTGIIGKKHVGPSSVYQFDYEQTEENNPINSVGELKIIGSLVHTFKSCLYFIIAGRNISHIRRLVSDFLDEAGEAGWALYVTPHDPHRCGHTQPRSVKI